MKKAKKITKNDFIGNYLDKKMKNHDLPWSMQYYSLLHKNTDEAEAKWKAKQKKLKKQNQK